MNLRKPTRAQKELMAKHGCVPGNWLVIKETADSLEISSRKAGKKRILKK